MMCLMNSKEIADTKLKSSCEFIPIENRQHWLELRKLGIGGSDVAGIFNDSPFTDRRKVYLSKQKEHKPEEISNSAIDFGNDMEDIIFQAFAVKHAKEYDCINYKDIMFRNYFIPYFQASLDGVLVDKITKQVGVLEIKTVQPSAKYKWYNNGELTIPKYYKYQILHYLNVTGLDFAVVTALANVESGDSEMIFMKPRIYYREELAEELNIIKNECIDFWENIVLKQIEPGIWL